MVYVGGVKFNLAVEDIVVPEFCPIMKIRLIPGSGDSAPSLDRIDNRYSYVPGNVAVISNRANTLKSSLDIETLKNIIRYIEMHAEHLPTSVDDLYVPVRAQTDHAGRSAFTPAFFRKCGKRAKRPKTRDQMTSEEIKRYQEWGRKGAQALKDKKITR